MSARAGANASGQSRGGVDKAWASGRVLTAEQRARKQDADRKANRFLKKEVQDRLALLEEKVMQLEASRINDGNHTPAGSGVIVTSLGTTPSIGVVVSPQPNTPFDGSLTSNTDRDIPWTGMYPCRRRMPTADQNRHCRKHFYIRLLTYGFATISAN